MNQTSRELTVSMTSRPSTSCLTELAEVSSPSAELTFSNLFAPTKSSPSAHTLTSVASPSSSFFNEDSFDSLEENSATESVQAKSYMRRTRGRNIDKKQSNKAAAIKYRNKKLQEKELLFAECNEYAKKNSELKKKIDEVQTEISFIKSLLVEALIAKNLSK